MQRPEFRPPTWLRRRERHQPLRRDAVAGRAEDQVIDPIRELEDQAVDEMPDVGSDATPPVSRRQRGRIDKDNSAAILVRTALGVLRKPVGRPTLAALAFAGLWVTAILSRFGWEVHGVRL